MTNNTRELIAIDIVNVLKDIPNPRLVLVTREPFAVEELAITQFPAVLVTTGVEERDTVTMSAGLRQSTINYNIRGFVRGIELDTRRNVLIEAIEEALDADRYRDLGNSRVLNSQVTSIEVVERMAPLAEVMITFSVTYVFTRGTA
jgi:molecular chaperone DnaK (HSP70)